jgi:predicted NBD/HSP70 family sugar kinase
VLRLLRDSGPHSRSRIAAETGLPKPSISSLISELIDLGLVRETYEERLGSVGRPALLIELDGRALCGIGAEIGVNFVSASALALHGKPVYERRLAVDVPAEGPDVVLGHITMLIREALGAIRESAPGGRCVGLTVASPGVVDIEKGVTQYAPNIGWHEVPVLAELRARLGPQSPPLALENDAKLGAIAEYLVVQDRDIHDMLYVADEVGVGGGIVSGGRLLRGSTGHSGEMGHMPLDPGGTPCGCGRRGCW